MVFITKKKKGQKVKKGAKSNPKEQMGAKRPKKGQKETQMYTKRQTVSKMPPKGQKSGGKMWFPYYETLHKKLHVMKYSPL